MSYSKNIKNLFTQSNVTVNNQVNERIINDSLNVLNESQDLQLSPIEHNIWRLIMKSKITKITTAAVLIGAIFFSLTLVDESTAPVYAIEQTIQIMQTIRTAHAYSTNWDGSEEEIFMQINPETGEEEYYYVDKGDMLIIANPQKTYFYNKDENHVRILNEHMIWSEVRITRFVEDMKDWVQAHNGKLDIRNKFDKNLRKNVIRLYLNIPAQGTFEGENSIINIDPETKLPINFELHNQNGSKTLLVHNIEYNVQIPQGLFDFEIPEGAEVEYE